MILNANSIVQHVPIIILKIVVSAKKILVRILAHAFVRIASI